jgi:hypothetical protein
MLFDLLAAVSIIFWSGLWAYSTLLVLLVIMKETESMYAYPMRMALDRFVDALGFSWLKPLHDLQLQRLRLISYSLFGVVTLGVGIVLLLVD